MSVQISDAFLTAVLDGQLSNKDCELVALAEEPRDWPDIVVRYADSLVSCKVCDGTGELLVLDGKWPCWLCGGCGETRGYGRMMGHSNPVKMTRDGLKFEVPDVTFPFLCDGYVRYAAVVVPAEQQILSVHPIRTISATEGEEVTLEGIHITFSHSHDRF